MKSTQISVKPAYTLKPTYTPLPSSQKKNCNIDKLEPGAKQASTKSESTSNYTSSKSEANAKHAATRSDSAIKAQSLIRAANEDDDLYDPYSDFHDGTLRPLEFEKDPWN